MKKLIIIILLLLFIVLLTSAQPKPDDVNWEYVYENKSHLRPIYTPVQIYDKENKSNWTTYNITGYFMHYEYGKERLGLKVENKTYNRNSAVQGKKVCYWIYDIRDRDITSERYGCCTPAEKRKGVCYEKSLNEAKQGIGISN
jgi:hypothetical protein